MRQRQRLALKVSLALGIVRLPAPPNVVGRAWAKDLWFLSRACVGYPMRRQTAPRFAAWELNLALSSALLRLCAA